MAFRSEVDNGARLVRFQKPPHQIAFANVALNKRVSGERRDTLQILQVSRVGQFVEVYEQCRLVPYLLQNEVGTDKSRASRDQNRILHACLDWLPAAAGYPSRPNPLDCNKKVRGSPLPHQ
jgi:hypothetical protein